MRRSAPRTATQYFQKPERFKQLWDKVVGVITKMRGEKISLTKASQESGVSAQTVKRWAGSALQKRPGGKWAVKRSDSLLRVLMVPTPEGAREIGVAGSRQATLLGKYWNALHRYFETGDRSRLENFQGKYVTDANGIRFPLLTDRAELKRLGSAGVFSFESLYGRSS
jgi:hypothetical protein